MIAAYLEDFGPVALVPDSEDKSDTAGEEQRLAVFEQGYSAGWDDAIAAQARNTQIASDAFAKNLGDLSFTYQEAVQHVTAALTPFLKTLAETLVPDALDAGFVQRIAGQLAEAIELESSVDVAVRCAPSRQPIVSAALPKLIDMPVKVVADNSLSPDAVSIGFATSERHIDLSELSEHIRQSIDGFAFQLDKDRSHG